MRSGSISFMADPVGRYGLRTIRYCGAGNYAACQGLALPPRPARHVEAMPPEARVGIWMFEWYWKQLNVTGLDHFVAEVRKRSDGKMPTARTWFGYAAIHAYGQACEKAKTIEAKGVAKVPVDPELPPEITLQPNKVYFRGGDHHLMLSSYIGVLLQKGDGDPGTYSR
jgi:branched-chain amino acid transport system substrate-binding protein